jgi:hypothetical protein
VEPVKASGMTGSRLAVPLVSGSPTVSPSSAEIQSGQPPAALRPVAAVVGLVLVVAVPAAVLSVAVSGFLSRWLPAGPRLVPTAAAVDTTVLVDRLRLLGWGWGIPLATFALARLAVGGFDPGGQLPVIVLAVYGVGVLLISAGSIGTHAHGGRARTNVPGLAGSG